jgi:AraC family transcriptional regulator
MAKRKPPPVRPLGSQKNLQIRWKAFDYCSPLNRVRAHLLAHITEPFSLEAAADVACRERTYFSRFFLEWTGVNFKYWVDFEKIQYAARLLQFPDASVSSVAMDCGFGHEMFTRTFKRITGTTPLAFRNERTGRFRPQSQ